VTATRRRERAQAFGRYELLIELGRGGMAELHLGQLVGVAGFAKPVAIKLMLPHISQDKQYVEMFLNEGRIAAKLSHPNVCQVYELGEVDGQLYLAMEYLEGVSWDTLAPLLPDDPAAALPIISSVIAQACGGLHYAHERGVIHRDVSPQNLFVTVDGACKVLDFGVSKLMTDGPRTHTGVLKGKLPYMAPEQIAGEAVDARADVFAAGIVLWEALTGEHLFARETDYLIWNAVLSDPIPPVEGFGADVAGIASRALERDRERRFQTVKELAVELRRVAPPASNDALAELVRTRCGDQLAERSRVVSRVLRGREPSAGDTVPEPSATMSMELRGQSVALVRQRRRRWPIVAALGAAAIAGTAALLHRGGDSDVVATPVAPRDAAPPPVVVASAPVDAAIAIDAPAPRPKRATPAPPAAPVDKSPGYFSIDSDPYAQIYIDGVRHPGDEGQTPLFRLALPPGRHVVRAVLDDHREQSFAIRIEPGKEVNWRKLVW
jgi:hypothetical protein